jgi:hypothetical protein
VPAGPRCPPAHGRSGLTSDGQANRDGDVRPTRARTQRSVPVRRCRRTRRDC